MLRVAVILSAALGIAASAFAQVTCAAGDLILPEVGYFEAHRPVIVNRKLSSEELAEAKRLTAEVKNGNPPVEAVDRLAVLAAAGDREMMKTVMEGYANADMSKIPPQPDPKFAGARNAFSGIWAMHLYQAGERSKRISGFLSGCLNDDYGSVSGKCGFNAEIDASIVNNFRTHKSGKGGLPKSVTFTEYSYAATLAQDRARFEKALAEYRNADGDYGKDYNWAYCWAQRQPDAEYLARWNSSSALASANYQTTLDNRRTRAKADLDRKVVDWEVLQKKRVDGKTRNIKLTESDQQKWESLSFWLGGKYLLAFASENALFNLSDIDSLCSADNGPVCQRQMQLFQARADAGRMRQLEKELALKNFKMGSGDVSVRTYDQDGNYLGARSMPAWQADVIGAH